MSFDTDPGEQARISASDLEQMCDEMRRLQHRNAQLEAKAAAEPIDNGGPAFLIPGDGALASGISIRDYFAAAALQGLIAHIIGVENANGSALKYAECAYKYADAMLAARKEQP